MRVTMYMYVYCGLRCWDRLQPSGDPAEDKWVWKMDG